MDDGDFFAPNMTLYQRLLIYCKEKDKPFPDIKNRAKIGVTVSQYVKKERIIYTEEDGVKFVVNSYPQESYPAIDFLIEKALNATTIK